MGTRKSKPKNQVNWTAVGVVVAIATLVFGGLKYLPSLNARVETRTLIAQSPDLLVDRDRIYCESLGLKPHVVQTQYWISQTAQYDQSLGKGYLFAMIINYGPAAADSIQLSKMEWVPQPFSQQPEGVDVSGTLGPLQQDHFYAVLLDVLDPIAPARPWTVANFDLSKAHYRSILFQVTFRDRSPCAKTTHFTLGNNPNWVIKYPTSAPPKKSGSGL